LTGLTPIRPSSILTRAKANRGHLEVVKGKVVDCANDAGPQLQPTGEPALLRLFFGRCSGIESAALVPADRMRHRTMSWRAS
jgi:hypothetical protein